MVFQKYTKVQTIYFGYIDKAPDIVYLTEQYKIIII